MVPLPLKHECSSIPRFPKAERRSRRGWPCKRSKPMSFCVKIFGHKKALMQVVGAIAAKGAMFEEVGSPDPPPAFQR